MSATAVEKPATGPHASLGHVVPMKVLLAVFAALVLLTVVTVGVSELELGSLALPAALIVAGIKGTLVALYFMHLRYDRPFNRVVFLACLLFVVIFISLVLTDATTYRPSIIPGQAPAMKSVHKPLGR